MAQKEATGLFSYRQVVAFQLAVLLLVPDGAGNIASVGTRRARPFSRLVALGHRRSFVVSGHRMGRKREHFSGRSMSNRRGHSTTSESVGRAGIAGLLRTGCVIRLVFRDHAECPPDGLTAVQQLQNVVYVGCQYCCSFSDEAVAACGVGAVHAPGHTGYGPLKCGGLLRRV